MQLLHSQYGNIVEGEKYNYFQEEAKKNVYTYIGKIKETLLVVQVQIRIM